MVNHDSSVNEQRNNEDTPLLNRETGPISSNYNISVRKVITTLAVVIAVLGASLLVFKSNEKGASSFKGGQFLLSRTIIFYHY
jgi:hypothetical protein